VTITPLIAATCYTIKYLLAEAAINNKILYIIKIILIVLIFPLFIFIKTIIQTIKKFKLMGFKTTLQSITFKKCLKVISALIIVIFIVFPIWTIYYGVVIAIITQDYDVEIYVSGESNSMYPTFGREVIDNSDISSSPNMKPYKKNTPVGRGDIVDFEFKNDDGVRMLIKRIIAIENDKIELRAGIVYLNGNQLSEPYTYKPRSTFGSFFLKDCNAIIVPAGYVFVMGDNRMASGDSREFGFVKISSIKHIISIKNQIGVLDKYWRDTTNDFSEQAKFKLDKNAYLDELNKIRRNNKINELIYDYRLAISAQKIGELSGFDSLSNEDLLDYALTTMKEYGNYNVDYYYYAIFDGPATPQMLIDSIKSSETTSSVLLEDKNISDIGIAEIEIITNGCPVQKIIQLVASEIR
jgi:signal peptidase I